MSTFGTLAFASARNKDRHDIEDSNKHIIVTLCGNTYTSSGTEARCIAGYIDDIREELIRSRVPYGDLEIYDTIATLIRRHGIDAAHSLWTDVLDIKEWSRRFMDGIRPVHLFQPTSSSNLSFV